jgi:hypothetical protein
VKISVVTRVGDPEKGMNMALAIPWVALDPNPYPMDPEFPLGKHVSAAPYLGGLVMNLREPVFRVGEILILDSNDRDALGRKPSKWDVDLEDFDTIEAAHKRSREVTAGVTV